ncbi:hypothetical protein [Streptomyces sp. NPDC088812]
MEHDVTLADRHLDSAALFLLPAVLATGRNTGRWLSGIGVTLAV